MHLKYVKTFESFKINEEISMKSVFTIITSLFLSLQSLGAGYNAKGSFISKERVMGDLTNIENDLERLRKTITDPELVELISRVQEIKGSSWYPSDVSMIPVICNDLERFAERNRFYDTDISESLNHLKLNDIEELKKDYQILLDKYETAKTSDTNASWVIMILLVLIVIASAIYFMATLNV